MTNKERAALVAPLLKQYVRAARMAGEDVETVAGDLVCDVLHYVAQDGGDVETVLDRAQMHFNAELKGEG